MAPRQPVLPLTRGRPGLGEPPPPRHREGSVPWQLL